jgi:uncharacterized protein DUF3185
MSAPRVVGLMIAVAGIVLLIMGLNATDSIGEDIHEGLTGRFTDKTTWFIVGGIAAIVGGGALAMLRGGKSLQA